MNKDLDIDFNAQEVLDENVFLGYKEVCRD